MHRLNGYLTQTMLRDFGSNQKIVQLFLPQWLSSRAPKIFRVR